MFDDIIVQNHGIRNSNSLTLNQLYLYQTKYSLRRQMMIQVTYICMEQITKTLNLLISLSCKCNQSFLGPELEILFNQLNYCNFDFLMALRQINFIQKALIRFD